MVVQVLKDIFVPIFSKCAEWTTALLDSIEGGSVVLGAFIIVLIIGMLFIPMRGGNIVANWSDIANSDFAKNRIHNGKYSPNSKKPDQSKMGKFEKGNSESRSSRNAKLRSM